jgi:hypothetical protein
LYCHVALGAEVALPWLATWHVSGANEVLPRGTLFLPLFLRVYACLEPPVCTQKYIYPHIVPREALIKSQPFDLSV